MKTFLVVPEEQLKARVMLETQDRIKSDLSTLLKDYDTQHQVSVVRFLGSNIERLWASVDDHVWSRTTILYQTYSIITELSDDYSLLGVVSGRLAIPSGIKHFNVPVVGYVNTTYIRCIAYEEPVLFKLGKAGRNDLLQLSIIERDAPQIETTTLFQELKRLMENFVR